MRLNSEASGQAGLPTAQASADRDANSAAEPGDAVRRTAVHGLELRGDARRRSGSLRGRGCQSTRYPAARTLSLLEASWFARFRSSVFFAAENCQIGVFAELG